MNSILALLAFSYQKENARTQVPIQFLVSCTLAHSLIKLFSSTQSPSRVIHSFQHSSNVSILLLWNNISIYSVSNLTVFFPVFLRNTVYLSWLTLIFDMSLLDVIHFFICLISSYYSHQQLQFDTKIVSCCMMLGKISSCLFAVFLAQFVWHQCQSFSAKKSTALNNVSPLPFPIKYATDVLELFLLAV